MNSDLASPDVHPWRIAKPGPKPPPGLERSEWIDLRTLKRLERSVDELLDSISPKLRMNQPEHLDPEVVSLKVLTYLEELTARTVRPHTVRLLLTHLQRGFRRYSQTHDLPSVGLPIVAALGLDEGLWDGNTLHALGVHKDLSDAWKSRMLRFIETGAQDPTNDVLGLVVMAAALFGGLPRKSQWQSLADHLCNPLVCINEQIVFLLEDNYEWIADPISEMLLRRLTHQSTLPWSQPNIPPIKSLLAPFFKEAQLAEGEKNTHLTKTLETAVGAHLTHRFAPDVASIALGYFENTALPRGARCRLRSKNRSAPRTAFELAIKHAGQQKKLATSASDPTIAKILFVDIPNALRWDTKTLRHEGLKSAKENPNVRRTYIETVMGELATITAAVAQHFKSLDVDDQTSFCRAVLYYIDDLITLGGERQECFAPSSICAYTGDILRALAPLATADMRELPTESRQEAYVSALLNAKAGSRIGVEVALRLFERTLLNRLNLEDEVEWSVIPLTHSRKSSVDANLVDPATYEMLLAVLSAANCDSEDYRLRLTVLSVLLYRFGLRRGEAQELGYGDLHWQSDHSLLVRVRRSRLTTNKSNQAIRDIGPILLPKEEREWIRRLLDHRAKESEGGTPPRNIYLFARPGYGSSLLEESALFSPVIKIVRWITGDESIKIRHFRHAFASRHFLVGRCLHAELDEWPHRPEAWKESFKVDGAWLRAFEMGHMSPITSIGSYIHTNSLAHYFYAHNSIAELVEPGALSNFAGLEERSLERSLLRDSNGLGESAGPRSVERFLQSVRGTWRLGSEAPPQRAVAKLPAISLKVHGDYLENQPRSTLPARFDQAFGLVSDRLVNKLDLSAWERRGISPTMARQWLDVLEALISCDLLERDYQRRPRLSSELIARGNLLIRKLEAEDVTQVQRLVIRALVAIRGRGADIQIDLDSANHLSEWFNPEDGEGLCIGVSSENNRKAQVALRGPDPQDSKGLKLFLILWGVLLLSPDQVEEYVRPFR